MRFKPLLFKLHTTLGIYLGVLILLQLLSGTVIAFRWELNDWLYASSLPTAASATRLSAGQVLENYSRQHPGQRIKRVFFPRTELSPYILQVTSAQGDSLVALDSASGALLQAGGWRQFPVEAALALHAHPLPGLAGLLLVTSTGLLLLSMIISGLAYGWPRRGRWRSLWQIRWTPGFRQWGRQLHKAVGFALAPLALLIVITGLLIILETLAAQLAASPAPATVVKNSQLLDATGIDGAVSLAQEKFPTAQLRDLRLGGERQVTLQLVTPAQHPWAIDRLRIDTESQEIVFMLLAADNSALWMQMLPLHTGALWHWPGRLLMVATAVGLLVLLILGWTIRWRRR